MIGMEYFLKLCQMDKYSINREFNIVNDSLLFEDFTSGYNLNTIVKIVQEMTGLDSSVLLEEIALISKLEMLASLLQREMKLHPVVIGFNESYQLSLLEPNGPQPIKKGEDCLSVLNLTINELKKEKALAYLADMDIEVKTHLLFDLYREIKEDDEDFTLE